MSEAVDLVDNQFKLELLIDHPYGCCFCVDGDVLQQWQEYGDHTKGVSIGFNIDWFPDLKKHLPHPSISVAQSIGYERVLYQNDDLEDGFFKICYESIREHKLAAWIMGILPTFKHYSGFIKNPHFSGEFEYRIVYYPNNHGEGHNFSDNPLQLSGPFEKPFTHYCLPWTHGNGDNALCRIVLGCNCEFGIPDLEKMFNDADVKGRIEVFKSSGSYRLR